MAVPEEVRKVPRPKNTAVFDSGTNGPLRYYVKSHTGWNRPNGGKPYALFGNVIGHIIDGRYVPVVPKSELDIPEYASYALPALIRSVSSDILEDLLKVYPVNEAYSLFSMAAVRVMRSATPCSRIDKEYRKTFLQIYYPKAALSKNTICTLLDRIGQNFSKQARFYRLRLDRAAGDHLAVDGMLKNDNSVVNNLSAFSRKGRVKNSRDISLMYAYSVEKGEPVCMQAFPGNRTDTSAYADFIRLNDIRDAILVDDTGFSVSSIREELKKRPDLHYLTPLKRNDKRITGKGMLIFEHPLQDTDKPVLSHKEKMADGTFLYSFRDMEKAGIELRAFARNGQKKKEDLADVDYVKKSDFSGVIVFESDLDSKPETIYLCYMERWLIELAFKRYKNDLALASTDVQGDYSVFGSEFVNYLSTLITCRILKKAMKAGILDDLTYGELIEDLRQAWRKTSAPDQEPARDDKNWFNAKALNFDLMEKLGLCKPPETPAPRKRGRPRKARPEDAVPKGEAEVQKPEAVPDKPSSQSGSPDSNQPVLVIEEKRKPGRPRKNPVPDPDAPKRKRGRPRKHPLPAPDTPKRKPGRPRKKPSKDPDAPKKKPGRPRKYPPRDPNAPKRKPGRPRKEPGNPAKN